MNDLAEKCVGRWHSILTGLGIDEYALKGKHAPCPICGGKDRFRFTNLNDRGGYFCNGCGHGDGFDLLMNKYNWDFKTAAKEVEKFFPESTHEKPKQKKDPKILLRYIANNSCDGTEVTGYLRSRGLNPVKSLKQCALNYFDEGKIIGRFESMIALIVDKNKEPVSYHVTYLKNRAKANVPCPKKVMPGVKSIKGCAVRFGEGETIAVTEGIETALAVMNEAGLPTWAALNAGNMAALEVPEFIKRVHIFGDNDANYTGQSSAYALANRLSLAGVHVDVYIPETAGVDFADLYGVAK